MLMKALKFAAGAAVALAIWIYATPAYNAALASFAGVLHAADSRFENARFVAINRNVEVVRRVKGDFPTFALPADQITYNIILLFGLFAMNPRPFRDRNAARFLISLGIVVAAHFIALLVLIESTYATSFHPWSEAHYGRVMANVWWALSYFYRLIGMFAIPFACWWWSSVAATSRPSPRTR